jgi:hypothetical protein
MSRAIVIALGVTVAASGSAQPPVAPAPRPAVGEVSLLLAGEVRDKEGKTTAQRLVRVRFIRGAMQPPETVWEEKGSFFERKESFFNVVGYARLYQNRYVVTAGGGVIDVVTKSVLNPDSDSGYSHVQGTRVVYRVDDRAIPRPIRRAQGIFAFDLATHKVEKLAKLDDPDYDWSDLYRERISPDGRRAVVGFKELTVHEPGQKPRSLGKGYSATGMGLGFGDDSWPVLWLDNARILTQIRNGELVIVTLDGTRTPVVKVPAAEDKKDLRPSLSREPDGRVAYSCSQGTYVIDVDAKKWQRLEAWNLGHGFEMSVQCDETDGHEVWYRGAAIGRSWNAGPTTEGYLAREEKDEVHVWSASTRECSVLKMPAASLIGWMK